MIKDINDLKKVVSDNRQKFDNMDDNMDAEYLSNRGKTAEEAYKTVMWHLMFHDSIDSLVEDEEFKNLINISGKHPEYYRIIRMVNRSIEKIIKK